MAPEKRCVLITGAAQGIGQATALAFAEAGWQTIGVDIEPCTHVDRFEQLDVADAAAVTALLASIEAGEGRLDALVNNAAVQVNKPLHQTTMDEWDRVLTVNLRAPFWLMHEALPLLEKCAGSVVNVSSVHAVATSTDICAYATSKGGLSAMTRAAALEWASRGVRVNAVLPGAVDTPMLRHGLERGQLGERTTDDPVGAFGELHPMGRVARPEEIAQAILYLADGERSSYVTGHNHVVDGGVTIRLSTE